MCRDSQYDGLIRVIMDVMLSNIWIFYQSSYSLYFSSDVQEGSYIIVKLEEVWFYIFHNIFNFILFILNNQDFSMKIKLVLNTSVLYTRIA